MEVVKADVCVQSVACRVVIAEQGEHGWVLHAQGVKSMVRGMS